MNQTENATPAAAAKPGRGLSTVVRTQLKGLLLLAWLPLNALAAGGNLQTGLQNALATIMVIAFLMGVIAIINGGMSIWRGDTAQGKLSLIAGVIIAGAVVIATALFTGFGGTAVTLGTPW